MAMEITIQQLLIRFQNMSGSVDVGWFDERNKEIATYMEYGTDVVPPRPVLQPIREEIRTEYDFYADIIGKAVDEGISTPNQALAGIGQLYAGKIINRIRTVKIPPALKPGTVKRKGHDQTLIDTKELLHGVTYRTYNALGAQIQILNPAQIGLNKIRQVRELDISDDGLTLVDE
jgi:hypothetical protein